MKPRLRNGSPVGQQMVRFPRQRYICTCQECLQDDVWDPLAQKLVPGRDCGRQEYERHQRRVAFNTQLPVAGIASEAGLNASKSRYEFHHNLHFLGELIHS